MYGQGVQENQEDQLRLPKVPGLLGYQYQSTASPTLVAAELFSTNIINPIGTKVLSIMIFDPAIDIRVEVKIQHSQRLILSNFSTKIGNVGLIYMNVPLKTTDQLILTIRNQELTDQTPVITFGYV